MNPGLAILLGVALGVACTQFITFFRSGKGKRAEYIMLGGVQESSAAIAQQMGKLLDRMDALEQGVRSEPTQTLMITATRCLQRADECLEALRQGVQLDKDRAALVSQLAERLRGIEEQLIKESSAGSQVINSLRNTESLLTMLSERINSLESKLLPTVSSINEISAGLGSLNEQMEEICDAQLAQAADIDQKLANKINALINGAKAFRLSPETEERGVIAARVYNAIRSRLVYAQSAGKQGQELLEALLDAAIGAYGSVSVNNDAPSSFSKSEPAKADLTGSKLQDPVRSTGTQRRPTNLEDLIDMHGAEWWRYS